MIQDIAQTSVDACTLNNVLNIVQLLALTVIVRLLRRETQQSDGR